MSHYRHEHKAENQGSRCKTEDKFGKPVPDFHQTWAGCIGVTIHFSDPEDSYHECNNTNQDILNHFHNSGDFFRYRP